jgi:opacity protein-like surface antigen
VYDQGRLQELSGIVQACIENGFTKQERVEAYKLLTLAYIYQEEPEKADESMLSLLRTDPYFEINETSDPAEFIALYRTFRTYPIYRAGMKLGVNLSFPGIKERVIAVEGANVSYSPKINFQFGAAFEIPLTSRIILAPEFNFQLKSFYFDLDKDLGGDLENTTEGPEKQSWLSIPILVQYDLIPDSKFNPFVAVGISTDYLVASSISLNRVAVNAAASPQRAFDVDRNSLNFGLLLSAGAKYKIGGGMLLAEIRYSHGLLEVSDRDRVFSNSILLFDYGYADSVFKVNTISATIGYVFNVFKPKKLNRAK